MALAMWNLGYPVQASKLVEEAAAEGRALPHLYAEVMAADSVCMVHAMSKDVAAAKVYAETITNISTEYGFAGEIASASIVHAWADGCRGDPNSIELLREKQAAFEALEGQGSRSFVCGLIAELCLKFGRNDEAAAALEDAIAFIARTGEGFAESEIYRLKGQVELRLGRSQFARAARWFERAIGAARKRSARIAELRASVDLARLLAKQRKRDEARAMLADIYGWFTEGFDTADLKDAKALLDELNP
jgi:tetratricopeptide (TPR) repeat protein